MKILFLGSSEPNACSSFYARAAEKLGHSVLRYNPCFFTPSSPWDSLHLRLTKTPSKEKVFFENENILKLIKEQKMDCVLNISENFISFDLLQAIRELKSRPRLIYHSHDNNFAKGILKPSHFFDTLRLYDLVFTTKSQNIQRYQMLGQPQSYFIPSAFEPTVHRPIPVSQSRMPQSSFKVSFIGTYDFSRDRYVNALDWEHLFVWGDRWKKFSQFKQHQDHIVPHAIYHPDFADVLSRSEITLGLLREEAADRHTQRTFEIPACGTLQIAPRNDEILSFFEEGNEIVCFESPEELHDKVTYYLEHDSQRRKIAERGFERVMSGKHTYQDRTQVMLEKLKSL